MLRSGKSNKWEEEERVCGRESRRRMSPHPQKCGQKEKEGCGRHSFDKIKMKLGDWFWRRGRNGEGFQLTCFFSPLSWGIHKECLLVLEAEILGRVMRKKIGEGLCESLGMWSQRRNGDCSRFSAKR